MTMPIYAHASAHALYGSSQLRMRMHWGLLLFSFPARLLFSVAAFMFHIGHDFIEMRFLCEHWLSWRLRNVKWYAE